MVSGQLDIHIARSLETSIKLKGKILKTPATFDTDHKVKGVPHTTLKSDSIRRTHRTHWELLYSELLFNTRKGYTIKSAKEICTQGGLQELLLSFPMESGHVTLLSSTQNNAHREVSTKKACPSFREEFFFVYLGSIIYAWLVDWLPLCLNSVSGFHITKSPPS